MFIEVFSQIFSHKNTIIKEFELIRDTLFSPINEDKITELLSEMHIVSSVIKEHVEKGAKSNSNADKYMSEYDSLVKRYKIPRINIMN